MSSPRLIAFPCAQPSEAIRKVVFGGQVTEEEADSLTKRSDCSSVPTTKPPAPLPLPFAELLLG